MRTRTLLVSVLLLVAACFVPTEDHSVGAGPLGGGGGGGVGQGLTGGGAGGGVGGAGGAPTSFERCVQLLLYERLCTTVFPVVCGGVACAVDEVCCQTTGACVAPGSAACPKLATNVYWIQEPTACGSNADCKSDEYCMPDEVRLPGTKVSRRCIGNSAHCQPLSNCAYCGAAPGSDLCTVCGCDGRTYASPQAACVAGVTAIHEGACGVATGAHDGGAYTISCGTNEQCPTGAQCCFHTGKCFASTEPWRCELRPDGTILDCASHQECGYCAAEGCAGPGICEETGSCGGEVQQVCGCDGVTYVNACWARAGGTRVESNGACQ